MTDFKNFKGAARRIEDIDLPRIGHVIGVGEDELHAFMDTEAAGSGFDSQGRPKMLFEPHVFYRNLSGKKRTEAVAAGLAYEKWGEKPYPKDSYPRLKRAMAIDETAALKSSSWGLTQILGENAEMVGYESVQAMVLDFMEDEDNHLEAAVKFIVAAHIDDDLRALAALTRPTTPADCVPIVKVYNGPGYAKNNYHVKFANAHNKWRKIRDTAWSPDTPAVIEPPKPAPQAGQGELLVIASVQQLLRDKGYPEVGEVDNKFGARTRNAILAFQADNGLPLTGKITDDLLAQLIKARPRQNDPKRESATKEDVKDAPSVKMGDWLQKLGGGVLVAMGLGGVGEGVVSFDQIRKGISDVRSIGEAIGPMAPWLIGAGVGVAVLYFGGRIIKEQVEAYRAGRHV